MQKAIAENTVVVFSKTWCPYSKRAKNLLKEKYPEVEPEIFESVLILSLCLWTRILTSLWLHRLDERADGEAFQDYLEKKYGQRTVPNVFISEYYLRLVL